MRAHVRAFVLGLVVCGALLASGAGSALAAAPEAPEVSVEAVKASAATFHGVLSPAASAPNEGGTYRFLYKASGTECAGGSEAPVGGGLALGGAHEEVFEAVSGLAGGTQYTVCLSITNLASETTVGAPVTFTTALPPETPVTGSPAKSITAGSAMFEGVLNPGAVGNPGSYEFLYRQSASECQGEGQGSTGTVGASGAKEEAAGPSEASGLLPNATYTFCLLARNEAGEEAVGSGVTFTTLPVKPSIDAQEAADVTSGTADLTARIDPNGADTTYRFEYGTTSAYGASVPVPDGDAGAGRSDVPVSGVLSGLSANTTYHWRVLATNAAGTTSSVDHTFVYDTSGGGLPDGREYELVTPAHKNGAVIGSVTASIEPLVGEDGSHVIAGTVQCFADAVSCIGIQPPGVGTPYAFTRTAGGWVASALAPSAAQFETNAWWPGGISVDAGTAIFSMPTAPAGEDDWYARQPDGSFVDMGPLTPPSEGPTPLGALRDAFVGTQATADLSHLVYEVGSYNGGGQLFEYVGAGNAAPASVGVRGGQGSTDLVSACGAKDGGNRGQGALSADGRVVFFTALACGEGAVPVPVDELFARVDNTESDAHTVAISQPLAISPAPPNHECETPACVENTSNPEQFRGAEFEGASADGSKVFFADPQQLTDNANEDPNAGDNPYDPRADQCSTMTGANGCNLYLYDFANPAGHNLIDVSAGDTSGGGPRVQGVMAVSSDGSHVYFIARGVLSGVANSQDQNAVDGADNLYVFERDASFPQGRVAFIATLPEADKTQSEEWDAKFRVANVTPDGRFLVFTSHGALTSDTHSGDGRQVFRYDAQTGELVRISIGDHGFNDNGNVSEGAYIVGAYRGGSRLRAAPARTDPTMSHDGAYVFFMSTAGLTPGALNDVQIGATERGPIYANNVYEYHDGNVYLISDGHDTGTGESLACGSVGSEESNRESSVCLLGSDATGANVFFSTAGSLVAQDTDTEVDIYDARICTGSEPCVQAAAPVAPCVGEGCHLTPGAAPPLPGVGSAVFAGAGNPPAAVSRPVVKPRSLSRAEKLAGALRACRKVRNRHRRAVCEGSARRRYGGVSRSRSVSKSRRGGK
jgi:hypothetical protein